MKKLLFIIPLSLIVFSCSTPSSKERSLASPTMEEMITRVTEIQNLVNTQFTKGSCVSFIDEHLRPFENLSSVGFLSEDMIGSNSTKEFVRSIWNLHLSTLDRFSSFRNPSSACVTKVRKATRYMRVAQEAILQNTYKNAPKPPSKRIFNGGFPQLRVNANNTGLSGYQSGDILVMRGNSFVSATIARIGDEDAQFSHAAIVFKHPNGKFYVVEALLEYGVKVTELEKWLADTSSKESVGRISHYRIKPGGIFSKSEIESCTREAFNRATKAMRAKNPVPYDFTMDVTSGDRLFCAEVMTDGCRTALGNNKWQSLPVYQTSFNSMIDHPFLQRLGISSSTTFAPSDMEMDPNFFLISEWVRSDKVHELLAMDASLTSIMHWMAEEGFDVDYKKSGANFANKLYTLASKLGVEKIPKNIPEDFVKTMWTFNWATKILSDELEDFDKGFYRKHKFHPFFFDYMQEVAVIRRDHYCKFLKTKGHPVRPNLFIHINQRKKPGFNWEQAMKDESCE